MRIEQQPKIFQPVKLILETQKEADKLFAILVCAPICKALEFNVEYSLLAPTSSQNYNYYHNKLINIIKPEILDQ